MSRSPSQGSTVPDRNEVSAVIELVAREAADYLEQIDVQPARSGQVEEAAASFHTSLPEKGQGAEATLRQLIDQGLDATVSSAGPRCFHFVIGGVTPAALGADWLASAWDQIAYAWVSSPLAVKLELLSLSWLQDLFGLPSSWTGIMTTGATMSNFVGLAAGRQWWGERQGVDVAEQGLAGLGSIPVFSSNHIHPSAVKSLSMLGFGRSALRTVVRDGSGDLDVAALEQALQDLDGAPAILVGTAGEPNAGAFDPIRDLADLAEKYDAWLHVDGAFGLFARIAPEAAHLVEGVERADSVGVDGHKWLNVPYDCGFAFVRDARLLGRVFAFTADYLPDPEDPEPVPGAFSPESSRRARSLAVWATLNAYGREGYRKMVEGHLALAQHLSRLVDEALDLERLAEVPLNIVCFRFNPGGLDVESLNRLNEELGQALLEDGRVYVGTTRYDGQVALRPAIVNWRTREEDVELLVDVVRELGGRLSGQ